MMLIREGDSSDPGWKKVGSGIRDKHPGSASLRADKQRSIYQLRHYAKNNYFQKSFFIKQMFLNIAKPS
jgi:hypothetical protein